MKAKSLALTLVLPAICNASPFAGSWNIDFDGAELLYAPETFEVADGRFHCSSCVQHESHGLQSRAGSGDALHDDPGRQRSFRKRLIEK
jgi:hypothetical protein